MLPYVMLLQSPKNSSDAFILMEIPGYSNVSQTKDCFSFPRVYIKYIKAFLVQ